MCQYKRISYSLSIVKYDIKYLGDNIAKEIFLWYYSMTAYCFTILG